MNGNKWREKLAQNKARKNLQLSVSEELQFGRSQRFARQELEELCSPKQKIVASSTLVTWK